MGESNHAKYYGKGKKVSEVQLGSVPRKYTNGGLFTSKVMDKKICRE